MIRHLLAALAALLIVTPHTTPDPQPIPAPLPPLPPDAPDEPDEDVAARNGELARRRQAARDGAWALALHYGGGIESLLAAQQAIESVALDNALSDAYWRTHGSQQSEQN